MTCFIVLHYMVKDQTVQCVESISALEGEKKIIVVDNASKNGSGVELKEYYAERDDIVVLLDEQNLGFARGNNVGCKYAKEIFHPDYYVVMNNDVVIRQPNFINKIHEIDENEHFDVLGPDIYAVRNKRHQSPKDLQTMTLAKALKWQKRLEKNLNGGVIPSIRKYLKHIAVINKLYSRVIRKEKPIDWTVKHYNVVIQGSCFIFSNRFMSKRDEAFFPKTFLYFESEILSYECKKAGFHVVYDPSLQVYHYENVSTISEHKIKKERERYGKQQSYNSITAFINTYKE